MHGIAIVVKFSFLSIFINYQIRLLFISSDSYYHSSLEKILCITLFFSCTGPLLAATELLWC